MKMKAGKLNRLLNEGFTMEQIYIMHLEIKKLALAERQLLVDTDK